MGGRGGAVAAGCGPDRSGPVRRTGPWGHLVLSPSAAFSRCGKNRMATGTSESGLFESGSRSGRLRRPRLGRPGRQKHGNLNLNPSQAQLGSGLLTAGCRGRSRLRPITMSHGESRRVTALSHGPVQFIDTQ
jgi:hypothetical protein